MKIMLLALVSLTGCASQLDIREGDCAITIVEVDARAATALVGSVDADGWVLVQRGECSAELVKFFETAVLDE